MKTILSISGGGIRGIIPCSILIELEKRTSKLTSHFFDMVAGTSTGALLASAVAAGIPASSLLRVYTEDSKRIFTPGPPLSTIRRVSKGWMYDPKNIETVLQETLGVAKDWKINDCPIRILLTAMAMNGHPWFFVKDNDQNAKTTGNYRLIDCAIASACAPTYFKFWDIPGAGWFADGGVGTTANPVYRACVEAFYYDGGFRPENTRAIALGTGYYPASSALPPTDILSILGWTTSTLVDSAEDEQDQLVQRHYPGVLSKYDWLLPSEIDEADVSMIPTLVKIGQEAVQSMDWNKFLALLG